MKKTCKKIKQNSAGFSLSEVLMAILILSLVSVLLVSGMGTVTNTYRRSVDKANAETLLSTTVTELRNEMAFASDVYAIDSNGAQLALTNGAASGVSFGYRTGNGGSYVVANSDDGIILQTIGSSGTVLSTRNLVSVEAATRLSNSFTGVTVKSDGTLTITGLQVSGSASSADAGPLSSLSELVISVQGVK